MSAPIQARPSAIAPGLWLSGSGRMDFFPARVMVLWPQDEGHAGIAAARAVDLHGDRVGRGRDIKEIARRAHRHFNRRRCRCGPHITHTRRPYRDRRIADNDLDGARGRMPETVAIDVQDRRGVSGSRNSRRRDAGTSCKSQMFDA